MENKSIQSNKQLENIQLLILALLNNALNLIKLWHYRISPKWYQINSKWCSSKLERKEKRDFIVFINQNKHLLEAAKKRLLQVETLLMPCIGSASTFFRMRKLFLNVRNQFLPLVKSDKNSVDALKEEQGILKEDESFVSEVQRVLYNNLTLVYRTTDAKLMAMMCEKQLDKLPLEGTSFKCAPSVEIIDIADNDNGADTQAWWKNILKWLRGKISQR